MSGTDDKIKGKANEVAGKVTGDKTQELKGKAQQVKGDAENAIDELRDENDQENKSR